MRLRQLARKVGVQPEKILSVLAENGHLLENEANSKLTDEQEALLLAHFAPEPEPETESVPESDASPEVESAEVVEEKTDVEVPFVEVAEPTTEEPETEPAREPDTTAHEVPFGPPSHATSQVSENGEETPETESVSIPNKINLGPPVNSYPAYEEDESYADAELIKTEVPELEGLKVLGKIELPEPKKPEPKEAEENGEKEEAKDDHRGRRNQRGKGRKGRNSKPRLNPIEYERRKAEREARRKKAEAAKKLKEKKKEHYRSKVKSKTPASKLDKKPKAEEEEIAPLPIIGQSRPKPKTPEKPKGPRQKKGLKKFWAWLNGEYDQF